MGIFDQQQNPFALSQRSLAPIQTGTVFDPLIALSSQIRSQQNDRLLAEQAKQTEAAGIAREDLLLGQKFEQQKELQTQKETAAQKKANVKATTELKKAEKKLRNTAKALVARSRLAGKTLSIEDATVLAAGGQGLPAKGQTIEINVDTKAIPGEKSTRAAIEKELISNFALRSNIASVDKTAKSIPDGLWTIQGKVSSAIEDFGSKLGLEGDPKGRRERDKLVTLIRDVGAMFDNYRKRVTGAQASVRELEILKKRMPVAEGFVNFDSKGDFFAKMRSIEEFTKEAEERLKTLRREGISIIPNETGRLIGKRPDGSLVDVEVEFPLSFGAAIPEPVDPRRERLEELRRKKAGG